jgi:hypothetical protein
LLQLLLLLELDSELPVLLMLTLLMHVTLLLLV